MHSHRLPHISDSPGYRAIRWGDSRVAQAGQPLSRRKQATRIPFLRAIRDNHTGFKVKAGLLSRVRE